MVPVGANRSGGFDHHQHHHQSPLQAADDDFSLAHMIDTEPNGPDNGGSPSAVGAGSSDIVDITAGQKMVSAMSGSLLTSLLGTPPRLQIQSSSSI